MPLIAVTRPVSPSIADCALTYLQREAIDSDLAARQHDGYNETLRRLGVSVVEAPVLPELPDAVFVEDTAVVVNEVAVMTRPLLPARQAEVASMAELLARYRPIESLDGTARLEGGDVLRIGDTFYVGVTGTRSNAEGARRLGQALAPFGYTVRPAEFRGCLHLKSSCTYVGDNILVVNPACVDPAQFGALDRITVSPEEAVAACMLRIGDTVLLPANAPDARRAIEGRGLAVAPIEFSELEKAEAGMTCCSIVFNAG